jgi:hypothetical protein
VDEYQSLDDRSDTSTLGCEERDSGVRTAACGDPQIVFVHSRKDATARQRRSDVFDISSAAQTCFMSGQRINSP